MNIELNMNRDWLFSRTNFKNAHSADFDDSRFASVTIPHTMRLEKKFPGGYENVFVGIGWYRKYFDVPEKYKDKKIFLEFDGVMMDSDVYLNGHHIYTRNGGYIGFSVDITDLVDFKNENVLAVKVSNIDNPDTPPGKELRDLDFYYYGGIYRPVRMKICDKIYISNELSADKTASGGIFVTYPEVSKDKATVKIDTHVVNDYSEAKAVKVRHTLFHSGEAVITASSEDVKINNEHVFSVSFTVLNPYLWHPDEPNLYTLKTEVLQNEDVVYTTSQKIGIRYFEMKRDGLYINSERVFLRGANRHQCYAFIGDSAPKSMQYRDAIQIKENGFNAVRACHYPQSPEFLNACDELGLLVIECQPGWQKFTESELFYERTIRDIKEMIRRDRNHPSIFLWEASLNETVCPKEWSMEAVKTAHDEMPGNQMFTSNDFNLNGEYYDVVYKAFSKTEDGFVDKCPEKATFTREWGDLGGYNQSMRQNGKTMLRVQLNTHQRFLNDNDTHHNDWGGLDASERLGGYFLWSWNDYSRGYNKRALGSGTVEIDRNEKPLYYYLKSMSDARSKTHDAMVYIDNFHAFIPKSKINIYSNCDSVTLYGDSKEIGTLTRDDMYEVGLNENIMKNGGSPIFTFTAPIKPTKELKAVGYLDGNKASEHVIKRPSLPTKIIIKPDFRGITPVADGSDLVPVYFYAADKNNTVIDSYYGKISVTVSGAGELVGKNIPRIESDIKKISAGVGFAFVRTTETSGTITISAKSRMGLRSATVSFETKECDDIFVTSVKNHRTKYDVSALESPFENSKKRKNNDYKIIRNREIKNITATCKSAENRGLQKLTDGETSVGTGWLADTTETPQSVTIELKKATEIIGSQIHWERDGSWYRYTVTVSADGENWTEVVSDFVGGQNRTPVIFDKPYKNIRFIKLTVTEVISGNGEARIGVAEWRILK